MFYIDESLTEIDKKLVIIKKMFERAITEDGRKKAISLIRSQKLIGVIHEYIKEELIVLGVSPNKIYLKLSKTKGEIAMTGFLKKKKQDVSVIAEDFKKEKITEGVLIGKEDKIGKENMNKSLSINIRSQLSSLGKNFDTLYERTFADKLLIV